MEQAPNPSNPEEIDDIARFENDGGGRLLGAEGVGELAGEPQRDPAPRDPNPLDVLEGEGGPPLE